MIITPTPLKDACLIDMEKREDERGFFARQLCARELAEHGLPAHFVQVNSGMSVARHTWRGMHYQLPPNAETKVIRCIRGALLDVILDLRPDSPTFKQWFAAELTAENRRVMLAPKGFAHGHFTLADNTELMYWVDEFHAPEHERGLRWDDPEFNIALPHTPAVVSEKDQNWRDFTPDWHLPD